MSGLLSTAGLAMLAQPAQAQSDPSDPGTTTTTTVASTTTTSDVGAGGFANTGGNSELLLVGGLGLGAAALAARRYAHRA